MLDIFYSDKNLLEIRELQRSPASPSNRIPGTAAVMASGGSAGFNRSSAGRNRDTNTNSPFVSRNHVPVVPKVSSNAYTVVQPSSANNPMAGCSTSRSSV